MPKIIKQEGVAGVDNVPFIPTELFQVVFVQTKDSWYEYEADNVTPVDGDLILAALQGIGRWVKQSASGGGGGESNTSSNSGAGAGLVLAKSGVDLPFRSIVAGTNITLTPSATELLIDAAGGGGGATIYPLKNIIAYDPNQVEVVGKVYTTFADADAYAVSLVPSATNPVLIELPSGGIADAIVQRPYVSILGNNTKVTGAITSLVGFADIASLLYTAISKCVVTNVVGTAASFTILGDCTLAGGVFVGERIAAKNKYQE